MLCELLSLLPRCTAYSSCQRFWGIHGRKKKKKKTFTTAWKKGVWGRRHSCAELTKGKSRHQGSMNAYLTKQHGCSRGSDGMDAGRSAPTLIRDAHCACGWQKSPQGLGYNSQTMPSSGLGGPASNRTKLVTLWDSVRKSPHKTSSKGKGTCGERCACPHGWFSPTQVSLFLLTSPWLSEETENKLCKGSMVWKLCWVLLADWERLYGKRWAWKTCLFHRCFWAYLWVACESSKMLCSVSLSDFFPSSTSLVLRWLYCDASLAFSSSLTSNHC